MEVACTLVCPKAIQEVIITHPDGNETQKCEKCEVDCPKGWSPYVFVGVCVCVFAFWAKFTNPISRKVERERTTKKKKLYFVNLTKFRV